MRWLPLPFGKHKGMTLPQVLFSDPDWFFWAVREKKIFDGKLLTEAHDLDYKASHIRIPNEGPGKWVVEYQFDAGTGKFAYFEIIKADREEHMGSSLTQRLPVIDMSLPWQNRKYDKAGGKKMLRCIKQHIFGSKSIRLTQQRCEAFFTDPRNFS